MPAVIPAIVAFAASPLGELAISAAVSIGAGLLERALAPPAAANDNQVQGTSIQLQAGGDVPLSFLSGFSATGGSRVCPPYTWGNSGQTPNAYLTEIICISDLGCALTGLWWNDQKVTLPTMTGGRPTPQGWPIAEGNLSGVDHLWAFVLDGTQGSADSFLTSTFGGHATRPFTSDMIGRGQTIVVVTALYDRDAFAADPVYLFESPGAPWYNIAKDSSVGGLGSHRWATPSTWEPSSNPIVQAYNLRRGVFYGSQWVYGGNNQRALDPSRLPASNWIAAINACDALVTNADSSTEPAFRAGGEVSCDSQPADVIDELLKSCNARMAESGGIYKVQVGLPGAAVYSFIDTDILISEGQSYEPFPGLDDTHNAIEATYPEPAEKWGTKDAPGLYNATFEAQDGGRRLVAGVQYPMVPFPLQVQRLDQAMINDARRFARHVITLPPDAWVLEPAVDTVTWTSARNGYSSKLFVVDQIVGKRGFNQVVSLREVDPTDYGWNAGTDQQATSTGTLSTIRPPAQMLTGWSAFPADFVDGTGTARRPGIGVTWDSGQVDVRAVLVSVREKVSGNVEWTGEFNYAAYPSGGTIPHAFLPATTYQAQGDYIPYSGREHTPSSWLDVTTNNIGLGPADLRASLQAQIAWFQQGLLDLIQNSDALAAALQGQDFANLADKREILTTIASQVGDARAEYTHLIETGASETAALAEDLTELSATVGDVSSSLAEEATARVDGDAATTTLAEAAQATADAGTATGLYKMEVQSAPAGVTVKVGTFLSTDEGGLVTNAFETLEIADDGTSTKTTVCDIWQTLNADATAGLIVDNRVGNISAGSLT